MKGHLLFIFVILAVTILSITAYSQTTEFVYQGQLQNASVPAAGNYDFEFLLFDAVAGGNQVGTTLTKSNITVAGGIFSVSLDFGANYPGGARFLEIHVRQSGGGTFTPLAPRQPISSSPYAQKSLNSDTATNAVSATTSVNALQLGGISASQYVLTNDSRLSDARPPTPGSSSYIQNSTNIQANSNFNISGTGAANIINATTQFNLNGGRVLRAVSGSLYAGFGAGNSANGNGDNNTAFGFHSGFVTGSGSDNSLFGSNAGANNLGNANSFFGSNAGIANTQSNSNSFFGNWAGHANTTGSLNSFFGDFAGHSNVAGNENSFFGQGAGNSNTGNQNSFFGRWAGIGNDTGFANTAIGALSGFSLDNLSYATSVGAGAVTTISNNVLLGRYNIDTVEIGILTSGFSTPVCISDKHVLSSCSSSQRYKHNILPFNGGLSLLKRLRPVTFNWNERGEADLGLIAEEVNRVSPLLVTHNYKGEIEGVKYAQISALLINAIKEQKGQIDSQAKQIEKQNAVNKKQEAEIEALKALVCRNHRKAAVCRAKI